MVVVVSHLFIDPMQVVCPGGVFPIMAHTGDSAQKGYLFSGFRYIKGYGFHRLRYIIG